MPFMDYMLLRDHISTMLTNFVARLTQKQWDTPSPPAMDTLQQEISHLEQSFIEIATRPSRVIRKPKPLTEHQKIIDLAG